MESERQHEMVSAYLDGELAPEERTQVDRWLDESAELRQLRDDLLAVRASLRRLPGHKAPRDFSAMVEDASTNGTQDNAAAPAANIEPASIGSLWPRGAGWRRLAWPAIAIAAALLIMVFDSNREQPRQVAHAPQENLAFQKQPGAAGENREVELERTEPGRDAESDSFLPQSASPMLSQRAKPAAVADEAAAPAASAPVDVPLGSAGPAAAGARPLGQARKDSLQRSEVIVFEVTPDYYRARSFEKLLEGRKIKWDRMLEETADEKRKSATPGQPSDALGAEGQTYAIQASDAQLFSLLDGLRSATGVPYLHAARPQSLESLSKPAERPSQSREQLRLIRIVPSQPAEPDAAPANP
ncbi:MAG TPA: zf-HC2 domain-containing protein [Pirellulales bacterium]|jgi:negative regulator of sigma E activity|nr:zf-HC2 domain-containing protein [Pirellulales bacterium]